ncbi:hypothetical protein M8818_004520 [Zalaria obscura]|uniref:Uncharacterized protein n=1 Tax=Zalaria obscura TaxID=2024903 RepID=A0ACC3SC66_9PEZI
MGALRNLLPLIILFVIIAGGSYIGYQIYLWSNEMADRGKRKMEKKHVTFTKDGMKVGVKELRDEEYADKTQNYLVKAWNYSSFPAYKSRFWNKEEQTKASSDPSPSASSSRLSTATAPPNQSNLNIPRETRSGRQRASSPGAFPQD